MMGNTNWKDWKELKDKNKEYLDRIDFIPWFDSCDDIDDLRAAIRDHFDFTEFTRDEFLEGDIFRYISRGSFAQYLRDRYGEDYYFVSEEYNPPIYIYKKGKQKDDD